MAFSYYSPGAINRGEHREFWQPLRQVGDYLAENLSDTPRASLVIEDIDRHMARMRESPNPLNDAVGTIINTAHRVSPAISRIRITRHLPGCEEEVWSYHTDVSLGKPRKKLDGGWKVATHTHAGPLWLMAIDGEAPVTAEGTFIEDGPVVKARFIHVPSSVLDIDQATLAAHEAKEALYESHHETIVGHDRQIMRWRYGETALNGAITLQTVAEGDLMQMAPTAMHIPPVSQSDGRIFMHLS